MLCNAAAVFSKGVDSVAETCLGSAVVDYSIISTGGDNW